MVRSWSGILCAATIFIAGSAYAIDVTRRGDPVVNIPNVSPIGEGPDRAIDNSAESKFLNRGVLDTGFIVTPSGSGIVRHLTIITGNDAPARDPLSFTIEGSNDGSTFMPIAAGALAPSLFRRTITTASFENDTAYTRYRVLFPTIRNFDLPGGMQVSEVQLATAADITSPNDVVTISYPKGAAPAPYDLPLHLFDDNIEKKLTVLGAGSGQTIVNITPAIGSSLVHGLSYFSANNDSLFMGRTPRTIELFGSNDAVNFQHIATVSPAQATANFQDQEFEFPNDISYTHYRLVLGIPTSGNVMQLSEIQLFGDVPPAAIPANDSCADAQPITPGQYASTSTLATGPDRASCGTDDALDVWYSYTPGSSTRAQADTCGSTGDTTLAVYDGCDGPLIDCSDDACWLQSRIQWDAVVGRSYLIRVAMNAGAAGGFRLTLRENVPSHSDQPIPLNYNFNGMVHNGEQGDCDNPDGFRTISDRALRVERQIGSIGAGAVVGTTGIAYSIVQEWHLVDIVMLGNRNTVIDGRARFDLEVGPVGDVLGVQPAWLPDVDLTGPQITDVSALGIVMAPQTRIGFLYQASDGGGLFTTTLTFDDGAIVPMVMHARDWAQNQPPAAPTAAVETQVQMGYFEGTKDWDYGRLGDFLNVAEAITSVPRLISAGHPDLTGRRLMSIAFSDRSNPRSSYAIIAASVRDAAERCPADFNIDDHVNSQDFFDFLTAFFDTLPTADFNTDAVINSQDFFDFLTEFFAGC